MFRGIEPSGLNEFEIDIADTPASFAKYCHPYIECFKGFNSFKIQAEPIVSTFTFTDSALYNSLINDLSRLMSQYMGKTKPLNASSISTHPTDSASVHAPNMDHAPNEPANEMDHAPNEPANEIVHLNTENSQPSSSGVTHFRAAVTKNKWKRENEDENASDSESSQANTEKITSDHSSDHYISSDDNEEFNVSRDATLDEVSLTNCETYFSD